MAIGEDPHPRPQRVGKAVHPPPPLPARSPVLSFPRAHPLACVVASRQPLGVTRGDIRTSRIPAAWQQRSGGNPGNLNPANHRPGFKVPSRKQMVGHHHRVGRVSGGPNRASKKVGVRFKHHPVFEGQKRQSIIAVLYILLSKWTSARPIVVIFFAFFFLPCFCRTGERNEEEGTPRAEGTKKGGENWSREGKGQHNWGHRMGHRKEEGGAGGWRTAAAAVTNPTHSRWGSGPSGDTRRVMVRNPSPREKVSSAPEAESGVVATKISSLWRGEKMKEGGERHGIFFYM